MKNHCPICGSAGTDFYHATGPVTQNAVFDTRGEAQAVPFGPIDLASCDACSFVFNRSFEPRLAEIGAEYETSQGASQHFGAFADALAADWIARYKLAGQKVLEVGCGSGDFLRRLEAGGCKVMGLDPLASPPYTRDWFDDRYTYLDAAALVCRHTLEHVPNVSRFLRHVYVWAEHDPKRVVLFELPDSERIFRERAFWDIYHEHPNYFTEATLRYAFERTGFEVLSLRREYGGQYLVIEARARLMHEGSP